MQISFKLSVSYLDLVNSTSSLISCWPEVKFICSTFLKATLTWFAMFTRSPLYFISTASIAYLKYSTTCLIGVDFVGVEIDFTYLLEYQQKPLTLPAHKPWCFKLLLPFFFVTGAHFEAEYRSHCATSGPIVCDHVYLCSNEGFVNTHNHTHISFIGITPPCRLISRKMIQFLHDRMHEMLVFN